MQFFEIIGFIDLYNSSTDFFNWRLRVLENFISKNRIKKTKIKFINFLYLFIELTIQIILLIFKFLFESKILEILILY